MKRTLSAERLDSVRKAAEGHPQIADSRRANASACYANPSRISISIREHRRMGALCNQPPATRTFSNGARAERCALARIGPQFAGVRSFFLGSSVRFDLALAVSFFRVLCASCRSACYFSSFAFGSRLPQRPIELPVSFTHPNDRSHMYTVLNSKISRGEI